MAKVIKGKYTLKTGKKSKKQLRREAEEQQRKMLRKKNKELKKQCSCNHIDAKTGKTYFKPSKDGLTQTCLICGGKLYKDSDLVTKETAKSSVLTLYTIYGVLRNRMNIDPDVDKKITDALLTISTAPELLDNLINLNSGKKKKNKKNKNGKNKKKSINRMLY